MAYKVQKLKCALHLHLYIQVQTIFAVKTFTPMEFFNVLYFYKAAWFTLIKDIYSTAVIVLNHLKQSFVLYLKAFNEN